MICKCLGNIVSCLLLVFATVQKTDGSGQLTIHLLQFESYSDTDTNGTCCDGFVSGSASFCQPCDYFIFSCLLNARDHFKGPCVSNSITTDARNDTRLINFGSSLGGYSNPFKLSFNISSRIVLLLLFSIYDEDRYDFPPSNPDLVENITYTIYTLTPTPFDALPVFSVGNITTKESQLSFKYLFQCDKYYYTSRCDRYCRPDPQRYTCSSSGRIQCKDGWIDPDCNMYDYCFNATCKNGGTCINGLTGFTCSCAQNYTGPICENIKTTSKPDLSTTSTNGAASSIHTFVVTASHNKTILHTMSATTQSNSSVSAVLLHSPTLNSQSALSSSMRITSLSARSAFNNSVASTSSYLTKSFESAHTKKAAKQTRNNKLESEKQLLKKIGLIAGPSIGGLMLLCGVVYAVMRKMNNRIADEEQVIQRNL